jgi:hypothetical protein
LIGPPVFIDQQWKLDSRVFAEHRGVVYVTQADSSELGAFLSKLGFMIAQLRHVLTAKDSTVMSEKNDDCGILGPQLP